MLESYPLVTTIVISTILAFILGLLANYIKLPTILGYLVAGVVIGPHTPGFIANIHISEQLAEVGVILLMFGVGLHFSTKDLKMVSKISIPGALIQMVITTIICLMSAMLLKHTLVESLVFGIALSVASTVVLLRALEQHNLIGKNIGKIAVGWLVIEDIAMVIVLVLIPAMHNMLAENSNLDIYKIFKITIIVIFKIVSFFIIMIFFGKRILPNILISTSRTGSNELMTLGTIAISSGFAFVAYSIFGASFALGAFMAGFVLNESKIGRKYAEKSMPLRDVFAVLFFVATGMLFNPKVLLEESMLVFISLMLVIFGKSAIAYITARMFNQNVRNSLLLAASLAQIGEFSFILAALSLKLKIFSPIIYDMVIASAIISIMINPLLFRIIISFSEKNIKYR